MNGQFRRSDSDCVRSRLEGEFVFPKCLKGERKTRRKTDLGVCAEDTPDGRELGGGGEGGGRDPSELGRCYVHSLRGRKRAKFTNHAELQNEESDTRLRVVRYHGRSLPNSSGATLRVFPASQPEPESDPPWPPSPPLSIARPTAVSEARTHTWRTAIEESPRLRAFDRDWQLFKMPDPKIPP